MGSEFACIYNRSVYMQVVTQANQQIIKANKEPGASPSNHAGRILACADTNAAADNLARGAREKGLSVVRVGDVARVSSAPHSAML